MWGLIYPIWVFSILKKNKHDLDNKAFYKTYGILYRNFSFPNYFWYYFLKSYFIKYYRHVVILFRKIFYVLCINVLGIDLKRQCLIIIFLLSFFLFFDIKRKPYFHAKLNNLSNFSQITLIYSLWINLFTNAINLEQFDHFKNISIIIVNASFFVMVIGTMLFGYYFKIKKILRRKTIGI